MSAGTFLIFTIGAFTILQCESLLKVDRKESQRYRFDFGLINLVPYDNLWCDNRIDFEHVEGSPGSGTSYNGRLHIDQVSFSERLDGQIRDKVMDYDVLADLPTDPLRLAIGNKEENLAIVEKAGNNILTGIGPEKWPNPGAIGYGSIGVRFKDSQSEFGLRIVDPDGGAIVIQFYARNGTYIDFFVFSGYTDDTYFGFERADFQKDIAGFSIYNTDPEGIGIDDIRYCSGNEVTPTPPPNPKPPTIQPSVEPSTKPTNCNVDDGWTCKHYVYWACDTGDERKYYDFFRGNRFLQRRGKKSWKKRNQKKSKEKIQKKWKICWEK
jgi:hypothetical protein